MAESEQGLPGRLWTPPKGLDLLHVPVSLGVPENLFNTSLYNKDHLPGQGT